MSGLDVLFILILSMVMGLTGGVLGAMLVESALQRRAETPPYTEFHDE